jgi:hypothetical protein
MWTDGRTGRQKVKPTGTCNNLSFWMYQMKEAKLHQYMEPQVFLHEQQDKVIVVSEDCQLPFLSDHLLC